jgi:hypothetical protein
VIYLYWYLGFGAVVFVIVLGAHLVTKSKESDSLRDILDAMDPDRGKLSYRILHNFVVPLLACVAVVVGWPIAIFMKVKDMLGMNSYSGASGGEQREFSVGRDDLQEKLSIEVIETRERVIDPLGAVPAVPFGHLHSAWKAFLDGMGPDDAIWSFSANWKRWGRKELRDGYVIVRGDIVGAHFHTVWKDVDEEAETDAEKANNLAWRKKLAD